MGTVNLLEACRKIDNKAVINTMINAKNKEWFGYREHEEMGGRPYSNSKTSELVISISRLFFWG